MFDPINPAPPVTKIIYASATGVWPSLCPTRPGGAILVKGRGKPARVSAVVTRFLTSKAATINETTFILSHTVSSTALHSTTRSEVSDRRPILVVPYMWIGDFVRCHTVVKLLRARFPSRPVDMLATTLCSPLVDYMPDVRQAIVADLPRRRLSYADHRGLADRLVREDYGTAVIMPRTWKSALAPFLADIPERVGWFGEWRFVLLNHARFGERKRPRMVDRCAALALPAGAEQPASWPVPELRVPETEIAGWRERMALPQTGRVVALAPGAVGPSKRWTAAGYAELTRRLTAQGIAVWVLGGPGEQSLAAQIIQRRGSPRTRPHRHRTAQRHPGSRSGRCRGIERLRFAACRGRDWHADDRHLWPDKRVALGTAQSDRWRRSRRRPKSCRASLAISRHAGCIITAACAIFRPNRCSRSPSKRLPTPTSAKGRSSQRPHAPHRVTACYQACRRSRSCRIQADRADPG